MVRPLLYFGNNTAFVNDFLTITGMNLSQVPPGLLDELWLFQIRSELQALMKFYFGIAKCIGYPVGLLFQILTVIFLIRGSSGYSRSARNWFLLVLGADIASVVYRFYELVTVDFQISNPYTYKSNDDLFGLQFSYLVWGLRTLDDAIMQGVICKVFFVLLYFPIHLSPIALTVSALIRSYCVKFPLRAKAVLTTRVDRCLMAFTVLLSLAIAVIIGAIVVDGWNGDWNVSAFGNTFYYGDCQMPTFAYVDTNGSLVFPGLLFMMTVIFFICAFNLISAIVIILVLFESKKMRKSISSTEGTDTSAETRATAMLLGMNVTLFVCFFISRILAVLVLFIDSYEYPFAYAVVERLATYLFNIPYYTNMLFIAGFSKKFYEFYLPCLFVKEMKTASTTSQKTIAESKIG